MRVRSCMERLQDLYDGKIDRIEELEEKQLDICGNGENFGHKHIEYKRWGKIVSANLISG